ncbi:hypothetical protein FHT87_005205 [Rhizobium sp. BK316]|nr:hypothetical protein [Rhizobium sp. BK316]
MTHPSPKLITGLQSPIEPVHTVHHCPTCERVLSVAEFIERFCTDCKTYTKPVAVKERVA